jgi:hypothetical protein
MPSKIETSLTPAQLQEFFHRCSQLKGVLLKDIQALADEFGVEISLMSARSFRQGAFAEYLEELKSKREMAESITAVAEAGLDLPAAAATALAAKVLDASMNLAPEEIGGKKANNISLAVARLRAGDDRAKDLQRKLDDSETKRSAIEQRMEMIQFDAADAVLAHAAEIKLVMGDKAIDSTEKRERVRKILFGEKPADFKRVEEKGTDGA